MPSCRLPELAFFKVALDHSSPSFVVIEKPVRVLPRSLTSDPAVANSNHSIGASRILRNGELPFGKVIEDGAHADIMPEKSGPRSRLLNTHLPRSEQLLSEEPQPARDPHIGSMGSDQIMRGPGRTRGGAPLRVLGDRLCRRCGISSLMSVDEPTGPHRHHGSDRVDRRIGLHASLSSIRPMNASVG